MSSELVLSPQPKTLGWNTLLPFVHRQFTDTPVSFALPTDPTVFRLPANQRVSEPRAMFDAQLVQCLQALGKMSALVDNWDGYGARHPSATAIASARLIVIDAQKARFIPRFVVPNVRGGVNVDILDATRGTRFVLALDLVGRISTIVGIPPNDESLEYSVDRSSRDWARLVRLVSSKLDSIHP